MAEIAARVGFMTVAEPVAWRRTSAPPARVRDLPTDRPIVVYCS